MVFILSLGQVLLGFGSAALGSACPRVADLGPTSLRSDQLQTLTGSSGSFAAAGRME